jgi:aminoglycoside phosphotransferase (APT) family kinase protein
MPAAAPDDTIPVRPDERFDEDRLAAHLRGRLPGAEGPLTVRQFGGGSANLTYRLDFGGRELVLRRPPLGPVAPRSHDMAREHRVLSVLHRAYPLAPRSFLYCEDPSVIGAPFLVMERRHGVVVRQRMPDAFAAVPEAGRSMSRALVDALAHLHAVDYRGLGLDGLGRPEGFLERQVEGWWERWQKARLAEVADMDVVRAWLEERLPPPGAASLVHNDYKLDNAMFAAGAPGDLVAILDWDMCTLGDPLADLGSLLCYWSEPGDPPEFRAMAMMPAEGFPGRAELVDRYAARSGRDVSGIAFHHVLGLFRLAVIAAQIYVRFHRGQTQDRRFEAFGRLVPVVAAAARVRAEAAGL